jgi:hypothetical protein
MKKKQHRDYNQKLSDMPYYLRGFSNNRWGGHKSNKMRGFRGSKYGPASLSTELLLSPLSYKLSIREIMI